MKQVEFCGIQATDTTANTARIAKKRYDAREKWKEELVAAEGKANFDGLQKFLSCVRTLTSDKRLLRFLYLASKAS
jgi:hypothetical protein